MEEERVRLVQDGNDKTGMRVLFLSENDREGAGLSP